MSLFDDKIARENSMKLRQKPKLKKDGTADNRCGYKPRKQKFDLESARRKAEDHLRQYKALAALYYHNTGFYIPDTDSQPSPNLGHIKDLSGERLYWELVSIESKAHKFAEDCCNKDIPESIQDKTCDLITSEVLHLFNGSLKGFHLNLDPRGYALKISSQEATSLRDQSDSNLVTDWGGYGILAPTFE